MKKNKSILWGWTMSYLCVLLIPLLSVFINYYNNEKMLKREYMNAFSLSLSNLENSIASIENNMRNYHHYTIIDETFDRLRKSTEKNSDFYYNTYEFQKTLALYDAANTSLNCAVYYDYLEYISSSSNSCSILQYYDRLRVYSSLIPDYENWLSFLGARYDNDYLVHTALSNDNNPHLIYAHTLVRGTGINSTIFITVSLAELSPMLQHLPDGTFFVIQSTDHQLYSLDNTGQISSALDISLDAHDQLILPEDYISLTSASDTKGFTCYLVVSEEAMNQNLHGVRTNFVLTLAITLLLCVVGVILLLYTNYRPVSELLTRFNVQPTSSNEFQSIATTYEKLQNDYHSTRITIQQQNQALLNSWLLSLLKGRINELEIRKQRNTFHIDPTSRIALIGFMIPLADQQNMQYDELMFFVVDNIFCELFEGHTFYHIEDGRFIYYLFDLKNQYTDAAEISDKTSWHDYAMDKLDYLCNLVNEKWDSPVVGVVTEPADNIGHCKFLYHQIMETFEFQNVSGGNTAVDTRFLDQPSSSEHIREVIERELNKAIKDGDLKAALNVSAQIFAAGHDAAFSTQKAYVFDAFTLAVGIFNDYTTNPIQRMNALNYVTPLMQSSNQEELKTCFNEILIFICSEISQKWQFESKDIILKIRKYVAENYTDQNLSVSSMADALDRNSKYISRVFKEDTGEGILDYINHYRIAKARELMQTHQYTLAEISDMVGYANVQAFRRAFVKLTGEIPSKYK